MQKLIKSNQLNSEQWGWGVREVTSRLMLDRGWRWVGSTGTWLALAKHGM